MEHTEQKRGSWSSSMVFLLSAVGSAVGVGNLWGFPYKMGANGGLPFLIIYLALVLFCGVVVMLVELTIGRKTGKSPILALSEVGKKWKFVGVFGVLCSFLIMAFYTVIIGYSFRYMFGYLLQLAGIPGFPGITGGEIFTNFSLNIPAVITYTALTFVLCYLIVAGGVEEGLGKFNSWGIPALFAILVAIIIYNMTLPGSIEGLKFMFTTYGLQVLDTNFNFFTALRTAGSQMLFSLSLGMGCMITYGSYLNKSEKLVRSAWIIPVFDTLAAVMAGLAIFPAVFATGVDPAAGPSLIFITMYNVFATMGFFGNIVGVLFYALVIFAGVSSAISLMEVASSNFMDMAVKKGKTPNRKKTTLIVTIIMFVMSLWTCFDAFGMTGISTWMPFKDSAKDVVDLFDFFSSGCMMPLGAVFMCIAVGWTTKPGWMKSEITLEGNSFRGEKFFNVCIKYITPVLMFFVFLVTCLDYFGVWQSLGV